MGIFSMIFMVLPINIVLLLIYKKVSHHYHWFDSPNESRKIHHIAKPTSAGLVFMLIMLLYFSFSAQVIFENHGLIALGLLMLLVVGGVDDFMSISVKFRLSVIFLSSLCLLYAFFQPPTESYILMIVYALGLLWWINLFNFMDGADGMSVLHALITSIGYLVCFFLFDNQNLLILMSLVLFILCLFSFLVFNFPKASLFMGDSGSLSVSFVIATFALYGINHEVFDEILVISFHLVFILDATLTLIFRIKHKHRISQSHDLHLFQALIKSGRSHSWVSFFYFLTAFITVSGAIILKNMDFAIEFRIGLLVLECCVLSIIWFNFHNKSQFSRFKQ